MKKCVMLFLKAHQMPPKKENCGTKKNILIGILFSGLSCKPCFLTMRSLRISTVAVIMKDTIMNMLTKYVLEMGISIAHVQDLNRSGLKMYCMVDDVFQIS